jgi:hypothetical protein
MPEWRLSLCRRQILEGRRVAQWEQETAQNELSSVQALVSTGVDISTFRATLSASSSHRIKHIVEAHDAVSRRTARMGRDRGGVSCLITIPSAGKVGCCAFLSYRQSGTVFEADFIHYLIR